MPQAVKDGSMLFIMAKPKLGFLCLRKHAFTVISYSVSENHDSFINSYDSFIIFINIQNVNSAIFSEKLFILFFKYFHINM